ncbi:MAG: hypothetical protein BAJALOKI2v1_1140004 [Promethearchaeota archaeon]|nr:MAG: hypothetical protein BAJALOKI2v1_1140004 [Candidatus Lokiarchaeota archaeon]
MSNTESDSNKSNNKSNIISLRVDEETYNKLNQISKENNLKRSELLRKSFNQWVNLKKFLMKSDSMIIGQNFLRGLFDIADEQGIIELGKKIGEIWINEFNIHLIDLEVKKDLDTMLTSFTDGIGPNEANWFNKINFQEKDNDKIRVYGIHALNKGFSLFFKSFLEYLMAEQFNMVLNQDESNISDTTIRLEFRSSDKKITESSSDLG